MERCFLHYLVILFIRLSDQNVRFRIKILRKLTVTQFFLKDRSEGKVPNPALDIVSTGGILPFTGNSDLCAQYLMCGFYFRIQSPSCHTEFARVESVEKDDWTQWQGCYADAYVTWSCRTGPSWVKMTDFSLFLKNIVPFRQFSCIYSILKTENFVGKKYIQIMECENWSLDPTYSLNSVRASTKYRLFLLK